MKLTMAQSGVIIFSGLILIAGVFVGSCASTGSPGMRKCRANCYSLNRQCGETCAGMRPRIGFEDPRTGTEREQEWHWTSGACMDECNEREQRCLNDCEKYTIMKSMEGR